MVQEEITVDGEICGHEQTPGGISLLLKDCMGGDTTEQGCGLILLGAVKIDDGKGCVGRVGREDVVSILLTSVADILISSIELVIGVNEVPPS